MLLLKAMNVPLLFYVTADLMCINVSVIIHHVLLHNEIILFLVVHSLMTAGFF